MTEKQLINAEARSAFDLGDYSLAFKKLWRLGVRDFVAYAQKEELKTKKVNWFAQPASGKYFWEVFVLTETVLNELFSSDSSDQLLHNYFSKFRIQIPNFEVALANKFPKVFVKAIRTNQVFLKSDRIELLGSISIDSNFHIHQKLWTRIFEIENSQWNKIKEELEQLSGLSLIQILSHCIIWLETSRFTDDSKQSIHHLGGVYSFFIELVLSEYPIKNQDVLNQDDFAKQFLEIFSANNNELKFIENSPVSNLLLIISNWIYFKEQVISPYSFDHNIEPIQENELLIFNSTSKAYYKWLVDGVRYQVNQLNYIIQGNEIVDYLEQADLCKIQGKTENDIQMNRNLAGFKWSTLLLLKDMACETFPIGNTRVETEKLLTPLITYSFNRLIRFEQNLRMHSFPYKKGYEPIFLMTENEYKQLNRDALSHLPDDCTTEVLQLFSYKPNLNNKFNRFQVNFDVWQKPFYRIGTLLFCPILFFSNNSWFYSFAQAALLQNTIRSETQKMEYFLGELIERKGWKVKVITNEEVRNLKGDVDIFVEDTNTLLFIQLKRTYFRLDLKDAYYEAINTDSKAAGQLNDAELYLEKENPIYTVNHKPFKWIVSTSFENIGSRIDGCFKVNYFELLNALNNPETINLSDLVRDLESDKNLKAFLSNIFNDEIPKEIRELISQTARPLASFESKDYKKPIFSDDEKRTDSYNSLYDLAIKLNQDGRQMEAISKFYQCLSINPKDCDAYAALANIYADLGLYENSIHAFEKGLELLPNDPYITRDYSIALMEAGKHFEGLKIALQLYENFPLLGDLKFHYEKSFENCLRNALLNSNQILELQEKWNSLN